MHRKRNLLLLLAFWAAGGLWGQNLVPNPYFNHITSCPDNRGLIHLAPPWYTANGTTVDLINSCGTNRTGIPRNRWGEQDPFIGNGYAGIRTYFHNSRESGSFQNYREYLSTPLTQTLEKEKAYLVSFRYSPGESGGYISDDLALALVDTVPSWEVLPFEPVLEHTQGQLIRSYSIWSHLWGTYIADGSEKQLVIGNFKSDSLTSIEPGGLWDTLFNSTYYFIDNVLVQPCQIQPQDTLILADKYHLCLGETLGLSPNFGLPIASFQWWNGEQKDTLYVQASGWYGIEVNDSMGCVLRDSVYLDQQPDPVVQLGDKQLLCPNEGVLLITEAEPETGYSWNTGSHDHFLYATDPGTYTLTANRNGCLGKDSVVIAFHPEPPFDLGYDSLLCEGDALELGYVFPEANYYWEDGYKEAIRTVNQAGTYYLELQTPCYFRSAQYHIAFHNCDCTQQAPNLFSPNDDGVNDQWWIPLSEGAQVIDWGIMDRWGRTLFESDQATSKWDGRFQSRLMSPGVYYWWLNYQCWDGTALSLQQTKGHLTLIR